VTFRLRLALATALAVAATVAIASAVVYVVMRNQLRTSVDQQLQQQYQQVLGNRGFLNHAFEDRPFAVPQQGPSTTAMYLQLVVDNGFTQLGVNETYKVPVDSRAVAVARHKHKPFFADAHVGGKESRIYTVYVGQLVDSSGNTHGAAIQFVRPTEDIDRTLHRLQLILLLVLAGGVAAGAAGGALVSRAALVPVRRLTATAERIAETSDPSERVPVSGRDELSRLGGAFNTMLGALEESLETQRRFVADASHELRTPLTSMQTNIEVLKQHDRLDPEARGRLFADLEREAHEMRDLIAGLLELARGDEPQERTTVHVDELVENVVHRARSRYPHLTWATRLEPTVIEGYPERLERAIWNLLENAGKWSREGSSVDVILENNELTVRDYGPGIAPEDREHVFDRFYRATSARALPGSGLGLAIVSEVAEAHGASVSAEEAPGGGALLRLRLPLPANS
jgi:two-component system sensor histidine kinase MprB